MKKKTIVLLAVAISLLLAVALAVAAPLRSGGEEAPVGSSAAAPRPMSVTMLHFSLEEMVDRADKVFRGTVVDLQPSTVTAGGGELPAVIYSLRVDEAFQGSFESKGDVQYVEVQMLGDLKGEVAVGEVQRLPVLPTAPLLEVGRDYLLLLTPPSAIGLSAPVGLGQGSFGIFAVDKQEWAVNEYDNAGLYDGPVTYEELASDIKSLVGQ